jgi:uncharacterized repeat protein (TIGR03803 family)
MKSMRFLLLLTALAVTFSLAVRAQAQTFTYLGYFNGHDGIEPWSSVIQATDGNFYGTTSQGGADLWGTVFQMTPAGKLSDIYSFCAQPNCADGRYPFSGPILGSDGNFYGVTPAGGSAATDAGTFYKMSIAGEITTLVTFCPELPCLGGVSPNGVIQASNGNFYGTTLYAGKSDWGTLFEISPTGAFKLLYSFCSLLNCTDGGTPKMPPIQAGNGNFYGTTSVGGKQGHGVVYEMTSAGTYNVRYDFCSQPACADGWKANQLVADASGNLYGTTAVGGDYDYGTVFELTTADEYLVLHSFDGTDGRYPNAGLTLGNDGNLYGVTTRGAADFGSIFQITTAGVFTPLYAFCTRCDDDYTSLALFQGTDGLLYGTIQFGGTLGYGSVFSLSNGLNPLVETVPVAGAAGQSVIILGNNLTGSSSVTFNGTAAEFTVVSDTYITAAVPPGATTGTVSVTTPTGVLKSNPAFQVLP